MDKERVYIAKIDNRKYIIFEMENENIITKEYKNKRIKIILLNLNWLLNIPLLRTQNLVKLKLFLKMIKLGTTLIYERNMNEK